VVSAEAAQAAALQEQQAARKALLTAALPPPPDLKPFILFFDSLAPYHDRVAVCRLFRQWAVREWCVLHNGGQPVGGEEGALAESVLHAAMPDFLVDAPMQDNGCDCGVFMLRYAEDVMEAVFKGLWQSHNPSTGKKKLLSYPVPAFSGDDIHVQRVFMQQCMSAMGKDRLAPGSAVRLWSAPCAGDQSTAMADEALVKIWLPLLMKSPETLVTGELMKRASVRSEAAAAAPIELE
jgi:hypothetical protein